MYSQLVQVLRHFARRGPYLFHGSPERLTTLIPRQAHDVRKEFGNASAIYATTEPIIAIAHAVIDRERLVHVLGGRWYYSTNRDNDEVHFFFSLPIEEIGLRRSGFVYIVKRAGFEILPRSTEARCSLPVTPLLGLSVTKEDFLCAAKLHRIGEYKVPFPGNQVL